MQKHIRVTWYHWYPNKGIVVALILGYSYISLKLQVGTNAWTVPWPLAFQCSFTFSINNPVSSFLVVSLFGFHVFSRKVKAPSSSTCKPLKVSTFFLFPNAFSVWHLNSRLARASHTCKTVWTYFLSQQCSCRILYVSCIFRYFQVYRLSQAIRVSTLGPVLCYNLLIFPITACDLGVALFEGMLCFAPSPSSSNRVGCWWARGWQCTFGMWCLVKPCDCLDDSVMCDCRFSWRFKTLRPDTCDIMSLARSGRREGVRSNPSLGRLPGWRHSCFFFGGWLFLGGLGTDKLEPTRTDTSLSCWHFASFQKYPNRPQSTSASEKAASKVEAIEEDGDSSQEELEQLALASCKAALVCLYVTRMIHACLMPISGSSLLRPCQQFMLAWFCLHCPGMGRYVWRWNMHVSRLCTLARPCHWGSRKFHCGAAGNSLWIAQGESSLFDQVVVELRPRARNVSTPSGTWKLS